MSYKDIMKLPYCLFVIGMIDAPSIDYDSKERTKEPETAEEELSALLSGIKK